MARYRAEGEAAFAPRSRAPFRRPLVTAPETVDLVLALRKELAGQGLDAGADRLVWHLAHHPNGATHSGFLEQSVMDRPCGLKVNRVSAEIGGAESFGVCWAARLRGPEV